VAAAWLQLPILAIATAATAMAVIDFMRKSEPTPMTTAPAQEDYEDGI
ncbi:TPA: PTS N-acetylgalactosamine transporter subunit IIC, partial [Photobacterium damselae]